MITDFQSFFKLGMDRKIPGIFPSDHRKVALNLGAGNKHIEGAIPLDLPIWDADRDGIPFSDESVSCIYAFHILEHVEDPIKLLLEMQRVLCEGGVANIVVPYYNSNLMAQDLDHKHSFCEDTWKNTFKNEYYAKHNRGWQFEIGFNVIAGVVERNMSLFTQLVKVAK